MHVCHAAYDASMREEWIIAREAEGLSLHRDGRNTSGIPGGRSCITQGTLYLYTPYSECLSSMQALILRCVHTVRDAQTYSDLTAELQVFIAHAPASLPVPFLLCALRQFKILVPPHDAKGKQHLPQVEKRYVVSRKGLNLSLLFL